MLESHINAYGKIGIRELHTCLNLADHDHIPTIALPFDRARFGLSFQRPVLLDFDMPDLGKDDFPVFDPNRWITFEFLDLWVGEAIVAIVSLEPGEAWGLAPYAPT